MSQWQFRSLSKMGITHYTCLINYKCRPSWQKHQKCTELTKNLFQSNIILQPKTADKAGIHCESNGNIWTLNYHETNKQAYHNNGSSWTGARCEKLIQAVDEWDQIEYYIVYTALTTKIHTVESNLLSLREFLSCHLLICTVWRRSRSHGDGGCHVSGLQNKTR